MLHEEVQEPGLVGRDFGQLAHDLVRDEVGAAGFGGEGEGFLEPAGRHGGGVVDAGD